MSKRRELQAEWLEIWRLAGSPILNTTPIHTPDAPLKVVKCFEVVGPWNMKDYMVVMLGDHDVTVLFSSLAGSRSRGCKLHVLGDFKLIARYRPQNNQHDHDEQGVINQAIALHVAAAKAHLDVEAYRATGAPADELEARLIARASKRPRKKSAPKEL